MSEKLLPNMNKDAKSKSKNVIVVSDPVVLEWKVRLMEQFFKKSTDIKSFEDETTGKDVVSSILNDLLEKIDSSKDQNKEMNGSTIEQTISLSEVSKKKISDVENKTRRLEIVEVAEFNEHNYWKIEIDCNQEIEDEINSEAKDTEINEEKSEYYDNNWWKPNDFIQNIKLEIENYEQEVEVELLCSFVKKPQSEQEGVQCIESDNCDDISKFNEFNFWKLDMSNIKVESVMYTTVQEHFSENLADEKDVKKDDQMILNPKHKSQSSGQNKHVYELKPKPKKISQSSDQFKKSQRSNGRNQQQFKAKQNQRFSSSDIRFKSSAGKKPMSAVVMVYNLNPCFMDCNKLFNLISPIAKVQSIKFLKQAEFRSAMVELSDQEGTAAKRVMNYLKGITIFDKVVSLESSSKSNVTEFKPSQSPSMANGAKSFKDFSQEKLYRPTSLKHPPTRTLYFHKTPKMSDEEFFEIFDKLKAPRPYKVMWFPNKIDMGCLQFKTKREALEAICMTNLAMTSTPGKRVHLAFTYARADNQFYCGNK